MQNRTELPSCEELWIYFEREERSSFSTYVLFLQLEFLKVWPNFWEKFVPEFRSCDKFSLSFPDTWTLPSVRRTVHTRTSSIRFAARKNWLVRIQVTSSHRRRPRWKKGTLSWIEVSILLALASASWVPIHYSVVWSQLLIKFFMIHYAQPLQFNGQWSHEEEYLCASPRNFIHQWSSEITAISFRSRVALFEGKTLHGTNIHNNNLQMQKSVFTGSQKHAKTSEWLAEWAAVVATTSRRNDVCSFCRTVTWLYILIYIYIFTIHIHSYE